MVSKKEYYNCVQMSTSLTWMLILEKSETNIIKFGLRMTEKYVIQNLIAN
jgi:hypothetical protein